MLKSESTNQMQQLLKFIIIIIILYITVTIINKLEKFAASGWLIHL